MGNIINIIKYKFKYEYSSILQFIILLVISIALSITEVDNFSLGMIAQVILIVMVSIQFFITLVDSLKFLFKDKGGMLLLAPIKTNEYIISSYIIFAIYLLVYGVLFGITIIISEILGCYNLLSMGSYILLGEQLFFGFAIIQSILLISISLLRNKKMRVIAVILGIILEGFIEDIIKFIVYLFPYVYIKIGNYDIDIIKDIFAIIYLLIIYKITVKITDKNLGIK